MDKPLINILVRTSYRPKQFKRMMDSIDSQSYKKLRVICSYDDDRALSYIPDYVEKARVEKHDDMFFYDNYCNALKSLVEEGYYFFLDDSDYLLDQHRLSKLSSIIKGKNGVIVQMDRNGVVKPSNKQIYSKSIQAGKIGMPCLVAHHSTKNLVDFDGSVPAADYTWIKNMSQKINMDFMKFTLVCTENRNKGEMENE